VKSDGAPLQQREDREHVVNREYQFLFLSVGLLGIPCVRFYFLEDLLDSPRDNLGIKLAGGYNTPLRERRREILPLFSHS